MVNRDVKTAKSVQEVQNLSFDTDYNVSVVEALVYDPTTDTLERMVQPTGDPKYSTNHIDEASATTTYTGKNGRPDRRTR